MKKIVCFLLAVILCFGALSACSKTNTQNNTTTVAVKTTVTTIETTVAATSATKLYTIISKTISQGNIHIRYPQLKGFKDISKEKIINNLIKNTVWNNNVEAVVKSYSDEPNIINQLSQDLNYQVALNTDEFFSVVYTGTAYIEGGAHPDGVVDAITIDIKNAAILKLTDFTAIDNKLAEKIRSSKEMTNEAVKDGMDKNELIGLVQSYNDQTIIQGLKEKQGFSTFYLTPNSLVISVAVIHAAGDYALVTLPGKYAIQ